MTNDLSSNKPILCLDFDGVCHSYTSGWQGADVISDPPVEGLFDFLEEVEQAFDIQIFSSRSNQPGGILAMQQWFGRWFLQRIWNTVLQEREKGYEIFCPRWLSFPREKPPAFVGLDDAVITFEGKWPSLNRLLNFKPWHQKQKEILGWRIIAKNH